MQVETPYIPCDLLVRIADLGGPDLRLAFAKTGNRDLHQALVAGNSSAVKSALMRAIRRAEDNPIRLDALLQKPLAQAYLSGLTPPLLRCSGAKAAQDRLRHVLWHDSPAVRSLLNATVVAEAKVAQRLLSAGLAGDANVFRYLWTSLFLDDPQSISMPLTSKWEIIDAAMAGAKTIDLRICYAPVDIETEPDHVLGVWNKNLRPRDGKILDLDTIVIDKSLTIDGIYSPERWATMQLSLSKISQTLCTLRLDWQDLAAIYDHHPVLLDTFFVWLHNFPKLVELDLCASLGSGTRLSASEVMMNIAGFCLPNLHTLRVDAHQSCSLLYGLSSLVQRGPTVLPNLSHLEIQKVENHFLVGGQVISLWRHFARWSSQLERFTIAWDFADCAGPRADAFYQATRGIKMLEVFGPRSAHEVRATPRFASLLAKRSMGCFTGYRQHLDECV